MTIATGRIPFTRGWGVGLAFVTACISGVAVYLNSFAVTAFADATVYTTVKNGVAAAIILAALAAAASGDLLAIRLGGGELMIFAATLLWAVEFVLAKRLLRTFGSLTVGGARLGFGLVVLVAWLAVTGRADEVLALSGRQWAWALLTGAILAGFVASWYAALARAQAVDVTAVLVFAAVITAALAGAFEGVVPAGTVALGLVLIGLGAGVAAVGALRRAPVREEVR